jgi:hypothetical protein
MDYRIDTKNIISRDLDVLQRSLYIINEHLELERTRGASAETRANILIPFITIGASVILGFSTSIGVLSSPIIVLIRVLYTTTIIFFAKSTFYTLASFRVVHHKRLTPQMVNDIQELELIDALAYEVKWKIWEYNQLIPVNTQKLYYIYRAQQNLMLAILSVLLLSLAQFISQYISCQSDCFHDIQFLIGTLGIIFGVFSDPLIEKKSFWNKKD